MGRFADTSGYSTEENELWESIKEKQGKTFFTAKGLEYSIRVIGNELFVDRKEKSITRSTVNIAWRRWKDNPDCGPKALGVFGASYIWGLLREVEIWCASSV